ncbi:similar to Saccharomyces cerevisiae YOR258W HNT3 DNA 5' AMP hydrolase involved in DNA repair [Maudiozyma barnettii]|uniref:Similar to Saccharomyces cerevisiae YOR258W HNT3 DNA 5' AMP hydrolase involved in DNA repair n=1 Tax=Maudiozyma barnettii TaxID=61262 RepID=A0A8H2VK72_9SACH|nr:similar to Saccharomyces cerevisiae YOR258W HNT3 DNA 5' AMP hydrolase involved in DNA repair [Kazachstania barnettii]CAB4257209.1 similar to Saccharomyces cerevisiae YOR258W HNT3 DNA 5' AMP hydrolase involved in DNA repair [Kazachstania barnettii]CAD1779579.1 similar to Saccharomyces cerevisiae YOR258W HNT3 DNA 5' AMP hydrolase involved in DNA repair [Kazachstania barnettii]
MSWRGALQQYITHPERFETLTESYSGSRVIYHDSKVVLITDGFPKASEHILILPRNPVLSKLHPTVALTDNVKRKMEPYIEIGTDYIVDQFTKKYSILDKNLKDDFKKKFIQSGIHRVPSMNNLHIHIITKDFYSARLKNKKHFNSFNTDFFVKWDDLPLPEKPLDNKLVEKEYLRDHDLICCYCGKNFTNKFSKLKEHLKVEFYEKFEDK